MRGARHGDRVGAGGAIRHGREPRRAAVVAHARHCHTDYEELLSDGYSRYEAREAVRGDIGEVLAGWEAPEEGPHAPATREEAGVE